DGSCRASMRGSMPPPARNPTVPPARPAISTTETIRAHGASAERKNTAHTTPATRPATMKAAVVSSVPQNAPLAWLPVMSTNGELHVWLTSSCISARRAAISSSLSDSGAATVIVAGGTPRSPSVWAAVRAAASPGNEATTLYGVSKCRPGSALMFPRLLASLLCPIDNLCRWSRRSPWCARTHGNPGHSCVTLGRPPHPLVEGDVVGHHPALGEARLERPPAGAPIERGGQPQGLGQPVLVGPDEAGDPLVDDLRRRPAGGGHHRRPAGQRFDHHHPERLGPGDRVEEAGGPAEQVDGVGGVDLADEVHAPSEPRPDPGLEVVVFVGLAELGRHDQWHAGPAGDANGPVDALLGDHPAEEEGVAAVAGPDGKLAGVDA